LPKLAQTLQSIPSNTELHVDFEGLDHIDHACLDLLMTWERQHKAAGGSLVIDWEHLTAKFRRVGKDNGKDNQLAAPDGQTNGTGLKLDREPERSRTPVGADVVNRPAHQ
jgi:hypothetical protein